MSGLFRGLSFWGGEYLPGDIIPTLENIRKWAIDQGMIWEAESQFIGDERYKDLSKYFDVEDKMLLLISLYRDSSKRLCYLEYPYLPVRTLIKKDKEVEIIYWQIRPNRWDAEGNVLSYGEVRFGYLLPDILGEEFCAISTAKLIVKKFLDLSEKLAPHYGKKEMQNGAYEIEVNGDVKAHFVRKGRIFDVEIAIESIS